MTEEQFDTIVIGTGQAGPPLAVRLAGSGRKTAIIERKRLAEHVSMSAAFRPRHWWRAPAPRTSREMRRHSA